MRTLLALALVSLLTAGRQTVTAQQCDDSNPCTTNDQCGVDGECTGTPKAGGSCNDYNDCTINDTCNADGSCQGTNAPVGTSCGGGCGTCQSFSPIPIPGLPMFCVGNPTDTGKSCDVSSLGLGPCLQGSCQVIGAEGFTIATCIPQPLECPSSGNCKGVCNPQTGRCDNSISRCYPTCETCNQDQCVPANQGAACDDYNVCTTQSRCETIDLSEAGLGVRGICMAGEATGPTPTPEPEGTPTPAPGSCVGDCNGDGEVTINELIVGVNIALGTAQLGQCPSFDRNNSGEVEITELIQGVNAALNGCAA